MTEALTCATPIGELTLESDGTHLTAVLFPGEKSRSLEPVTVLEEMPADHPAFGPACRQLDEFFAGQRKAFDLPLKPLGTAFQLKVWRELLRIPYGQTSTYGELAKKLGNPRACRAVGAANGRNPLPIIVPCHRVIGSNGQLTGFAGGLEVKKRLLELEGALGR